MLNLSGSGDYRVADGIYNIKDLFLNAIQKYITVESPNVYVYIFIHTEGFKMELP